MPMMGAVCVPVEEVMSVLLLMLLIDANVLSKRLQSKEIVLIL